MKLRYPLSFLLCAALIGCDRQGASSNLPVGVESDVAQNALDPSRWPARPAPTNDPAFEKNISTLLATMTLEQKVGQLIQPEIRHVSAADVKTYFLGSVLNGGGSFPQQDKHATLNQWLALAEEFYQASMSVDTPTKVPAIWGTDAVHGHNNVIGATLFPHNIGLGAANNPALIQAIGAATAAEMSATGISWSFAPTIAVARDDRWGRTYESYSEDPALVARYASAMVTGLQGQQNSSEFLGTGKVIATAKHFIADGGTSLGIDRGDTQLSETDLIAIHAQGYFAALDAGVQVVMASFSSWNGDKLHGHRYLLTDILKGQLGFDGFVVGDWAGHAFIPGCTDTHCPEAINAGVDMLMAPDANWRELYQATLEDVQQDRISQARLDDAVTRILRVKLRAGVFTKGTPSHYPLAGDKTVIGSKSHRDVARQAVRESTVLLKNQRQLLPLLPNQRVLVTGDGADNIGKQTGGWTISWQGTGNKNDDFPGATSIYQAIEQSVSAAGGTAELCVNGQYRVKPDVAIVVFGEDPYAEMQGDRTDVGYRSEADLALLKQLQAENIPIVALFITGRPLAINAYLNASDAFAVIWQPGTEAQGIADVLFKKPDGGTQFPFTGKLSFSWPKHAEQTPLNAGQENYDPQFSLGFGLTNGETDPTHYPLPVNASDVDNAAANQLAVFQQRTFAPWTLRVIDSNGKLHDLNGASLKAPGLMVKTRDRFVQEDAINLHWTGKAKQLFQANEAVDLSRFNNGRLVFDLQWLVPGAVNIGVDCQQNCTSIALNKIANPSNLQWQVVNLPLSCLGQNLSEVHAPFTLEGDKDAELNIYNIRIEKGQFPCDI